MLDPTQVLLREVHGGTHARVLGCGLSLQALQRHQAICMGHMELQRPILAVTAQCDQHCCHPRPLLPRSLLPKQCESKTHVKLAGELGVGGGGTSLAVAVQACRHK